MDVGVGEGDVVLGELLQAEDDVLLGRLEPRAAGDQLGAGGGELVVTVDAIGGFFDANDVAGVDEGLGRRGGDCL